MRKLKRTFLIFLAVVLAVVCPVSAFAGGSEITGIAGDGSEIYVNKTDNTVSGRAVIAAYGANGVLLDAALTDNIAKESTGSLTLPTNFTIPDGADVKCFIWETDESGALTMQPLGDVYLPQAMATPTAQPTAQPTTVPVNPTSTPEPLIKKTYQVGPKVIKSGTVTSTTTTVNTNIDGITMTFGADTWTTASVSNKSPDGNSYTGSMKGATNPKPNDGTGTYFAFTLDESVKDGEIEFACEVGKTKSLYILEDDTPLPDYSGVKYSETANTKVYPKINVKGGHKYTIYVSGSKMTFFGMTYREVDPQREFAEEIAAFPFDTIKGINTDIDHVDADLEPIQGYSSKFGYCDVSWQSSNEAVIANNGNVNCQKTETKVTYTGTFSVQEMPELLGKRVFEITVIADTDDAAAVAAAKDALTLGDTSSVKGNLTLPTEGKRGTTITWKSSDTSVVEDDGTVHRAPGTDKSATLTATITRGSESATKDFTITVAEYVALTIESYSYADASGNPRFTPVDGGKLMSVNVTKCEDIIGADDKIVATVYTSDGALKGSKEFSIADLPQDKSTRIDVELAMDSTDYFEITALNKTSQLQYIKPYRADDTVTDNATIYVVGDSTAAAYTASIYPQKGWAQMLGSYFEGGVKVNDLALSGRSSLSFKKDTNYKTLKNSIKKGDYLIVQFGHNDQKTEVERHTEPGQDRFTDGSYKKSMFEYVQLAWSVGAHPILATSISRRSESDSGLEAYVKDTRSLAQELSLPCVDLYARTNGWINQSDIGKEKAKDLYNWVKKHDSRFINDADYKKSSYYEPKDSKGNPTDHHEDNTHLNKYGADLVAQWSTDEMKDLGMPLAQKLSNYHAVYPLPSYADATSVN